RGAPREAAVVCAHPPEAPPEAENGVPAAPACEGGSTIPLEVDGRPVGTLWLGLDRASISPNEERLLSTLASYAGLALERQRLTEEAGAVSGLRAADELKTALLSSVWHDLKTPLASILASIANLKRRQEALDRGSGDGETLVGIEQETRRLSA